MATEREPARLPRIELPDSQSFIAVKKFERLLWQAVDTAGIEAQAAFDWGFHNDEAAIVRKVQRWRDEGIFPVFRAAGFGRIDAPEGVIDGVVRREDFALFAAEEFHIEVDWPRSASDEAGAAKVNPGPGQGQEGPALHEPPRASVLHDTTRHRRAHMLSQVIEAAQARVDDATARWSAGPVHAQLLGLADESGRARAARRPNPHPPLVDAADGVRYENGIAPEPIVWTRKHTADYLRRHRPK